MADSIAREKSYAFALRIVKLYQYLVDKKKEYVLSKQILRSGTSIGANVEEAIGSHSKREFAAKISIAYKEARETHYWLRLLTDSEYLTVMESESVIADCEELLKIIGSTQKTLKERQDCTTHISSLLTRLYFQQREVRRVEKQDEEQKQEVEDGREYCQR
jgi:four helix bundle protein